MNTDRYRSLTLYPWLLLFFAVLCSGPISAIGELPPETHTGGRTTWARLNFPPPAQKKATWDYSSEGDLAVVEHLRKTTTANVEYYWHVADIEKIEDMCKYPFLFMHAQRWFQFKEKHLANLREYMMRGGFIFIEDCVLSESNPIEFFTGMKDNMPTILPGSSVVPINKDHDLFHNVFKMKKGLPYTQNHPKQMAHGLYAVYYKNQMVALLSPCDLHCGWVGWGTSDHVQECIEMGVNIYIYAMTH